MTLCQPMNLFTKLPSITSFPPTLITLLIRWTFSYECSTDVDTMHNADESAFTAVTSRLVRTCPRLQYLWLDGDYMYVYRWRRTPRGSVELEFTEDEGLYLSFISLPNATDFIRLQRSLMHCDGRWPCFTAYNCNLSIVYIDSPSCCRVRPRYQYFTFNQLNTRSMPKTRA
jgi:hypothetical protein